MTISLLLAEAASRASCNVSGAVSCAKREADNGSVKISSNGNTFFMRFIICTHKGTASQRGVL
jgi:hypothetical protein